MSNEIKIIISTIDDLKENSTIVFFKSVKLVSATETEEANPDDEIYEMQYDRFILTKDLKMKIYEAIMKGKSMKLVEPFIILFPAIWLDNIPPNIPRDFPYPIIFHENKVYLVPDINDIKVYEFE